MPTAHPRHAITETPDLATRIDEMARLWPDLAHQRSEIVRRLIAEGYRSVSGGQDPQVAARLRAVDEFGGSLPGVWKPGDAQVLKEEWPA